MDFDRRAAPRSPAHVYFNKYMDGVPHRCEALEISMSGMLVRNGHGPIPARACYAIELMHPDAVDDDHVDESSSTPQSVWLIATPVWTRGSFQALSFVSRSRLDRLRLADLITTLRGPAAPTRAAGNEAFLGD